MSICLCPHETTWFPPDEFLWQLNIFESFTEIYDRSKYRTLWTKRQTRFLRVATCIPHSVDESSQWLPWERTTAVPFINFTEIGSLRKRWSRSLTIKTDDDCLISTQEVLGRTNLLLSPARHWPHENDASNNSSLPRENVYRTVAYQRWGDTQRDLQTLLW
jgi:hypothetical protein